MKKLGVVVLGVLVVLALFLKLYALSASDLPEKARFTLDLAALREAAGPVEAGPQSAAAERVASMEMPGLATIAGGPFSPVTFGFYSWQLGYADGKTVVLDPVHSKASQEKMAKGSPYDDAAWARQEQALTAASVIAVTHEHYDHLGGVAESAHFAELAPKLKLTAAQRKKPGFAGVERDLSGEATLESGPEGSLHQVAPGLVAITTPGHTPGAQLFYLRLTSGAELLLIGDVCWQEANLEKLTNRPRLVGWLGEDTEAIAHQMRAVIDFKKTNPSVDVVVAHDIPAMERRFTSGAVARGFH